MNLRTRSISAGAFLGLSLFLSATPASAHRMGESYLYLQIHEHSVRGRFEIALDDLNPALGLTGTADEIRPDDVEPHLDFLEGYYRDHVSILHDGRELPIRFLGYDVLDVHDGYLVLPFAIGGLEDLPEALTFEYSVLFDEDPDHRGFLLVEHNWATGTFANESGVSLVFHPDDRRQDFRIEGGSRWQGFRAMVGLGMDHIWGGIDHILFLVALLLPAGLRRDGGEWRPVEHFRPTLLQVLTIVTAFTLAHSVTLTLATLGWVTLPSRLVEFLIAASVAVAATDLLVPVFGKRLWIVVVVFGLFHGFGFAGALSEMGVLHDHVALSLLGFNLGVEIGQVAIVVVLVPILYLFRRISLYRTLGLRVAAVGMILVAGVWMTERAFDVDVPMYELLPKPIQKVIP